MNEIEALYKATQSLNDVAASIDGLSKQLKLGGIQPPVNIVRFDTVVWLDATGEYILIWYADGTGQILRVEGRVTTVDAATHDGKTRYVLSDGRELIFDRSKSKMVVHHG